ncbi:hypothetical protein [Cellulomonas cellasea]|uniref:Uncharacterized protein n=1 Tax=Cellulomonas cellasea TaxID=43670 RepID=A0A7W4YEA5_9CELL|nr:hypothetical protein [Cellulomonas cellasea]MBB2925462.1 hypothetical protein [Cellulomonas cellasea]
MAVPGPTAERLRSFERSVGRWLRAYPRRWRRARGAEVTAVLADLAGPDARRVDTRTALGLVVAGLATRWREHPPPRAYLTYRLGGRHPGAPWDAWLRDDVAGRLYPVRLALTEGLVAAVGYPSVERVLTPWSGREVQADAEPSPSAGHAPAGSAAHASSSWSAGTGRTGPAARGERGAGA